MADKREQIIVRLVEIAALVEGVTSAYRNRDEIPDTKRPAILVMDADEVSDSEELSGRGRSPAGAARVKMTPETYIMLSDSAENVGTQLNLLRAKWIKAVLTDTTLLGLVGTNGEIIYEGCATGLSRGRKIEGAMGVSFTFLYILRALDL